MADEKPISPEAEARKTIEALQAEVTMLQAVARDAGAKEIAVQHFRDQGVQDPFKAAEIALPHLRDAGDPDAMRAMLTDRFGDIFPKATAPTPVEPTPAVENRGTPPMPVPSPATPGGAIPTQPDVLGISDPNVQALIRQGNDGAVREMWESGQLVGRYKDPAAAG